MITKSSLQTDVDLAAAVVGEAAPKVVLHGRKSHAFQPVPGFLLINRALAEALTPQELRFGICYSLILQKQSSPTHRNQIFGALIAMAFAQLALWKWVNYGFDIVSALAFLALLSLAFTILFWGLRKRTANMVQLTGVLCGLGGAPGYFQKLSLYYPKLFGARKRILDSGQEAERVLSAGT